MKVVPPELLESLLSQLDAKMLDTFEQVTSIIASPNVKEQIFLPMRFGDRITIIQGLVKLLVKGVRKKCIRANRGSKNFETTHQR